MYVINKYGFVLKVYVKAIVRVPQIQIITG